MKICPVSDFDLFTGFTGLKYKMESVDGTEITTGTEIVMIDRNFDKAHLFCKAAK